MGKQVSNSHLHEANCLGKTYALELRRWKAMALILDHIECVNIPEGGFLSTGHTNQKGILNLGDTGGNGKETKCNVEVAMHSDFLPKSDGHSQWQVATHKVISVETDVPITYATDLLFRKLRQNTRGGSSLTCSYS